MGVATRATGTGITAPPTHLSRVRYYRPYYPAPVVYPAAIPFSAPATYPAPVVYSGPVAYTAPLVYPAPVYRPRRVVVAAPAWRPPRHAAPYGAY